MRTARLIYVAALACAAGLWAGPAVAAKIVSWVDENGVTHFGDPQFAGPNAETVEVEETNGMDVPTDVPESRSNARMYKIDKAPKQNKKGFRGHSGRSRARPHRYRN